MAFFNLLIPLLLRVSCLVAADNSQVPIFDAPIFPSILQPHQIAIIGGGAAGSSAAFHLRRFADQSTYDLPINITLFESSSRIGGRTTTVNVFNDESLPVELGASIFVRVNQILYNATLDFGLDVRGYHSSERATESDFDLGIWDGTRFVFKQTSSDGRWQRYWDVVKLLWKYGISPIRVQRLTQDVISSFLKIYEEPIFPFQSLQGAIQQAELMHFMAMTGEELLRDKGVSEGFSNNIVQASTRVNYAQNLNQIHGVESLVCMATDGAMAVEGGNWQIFDEMVRRADVATMLGSTVTQIIKDDKSGKYLLATESDKDASTTPAFFDSIILAAPYQFATIDFSPPLKITPEKIDYVSLHVTLFTSPHLLSPTFFGLDDQSQVPSTVLTTIPLKSSAEHDPNRFFSISALRTIPAGKHSDRVQQLYKIFSAEPLTASLLADLYGFDFVPENTDCLEAIGEEHISWYYHKLWHSYPYELPRTTFENIRLDGKEESASGVWYTSGIESFISTMETSALMGANVAKLIVDKMEHEALERDFGQWIGNIQESGGCGWCKVNPCRCGHSANYASSWCVKYRAAEKARETWQGNIIWRARGLWCMIKSLANG